MIKSPKELLKELEDEKYAAERRKQLELIEWLELIIKGRMRENLSFVDIYDWDRDIGRSPNYEFIKKNLEDNGYKVSLLTKIENRNSMFGKSYTIIRKKVLIEWDL